MSEPIFNHPRYTARRQELRNNLTLPEQTLWAVLRGKQMGVKFRRQHGIGHYIVDFYSPESRLVIELDGESHYSADAQQYDQQRDAYMQGLGLRVLRFDNQQVMNHLESVYAEIKRVVDGQ